MTTTVGLAAAPVLAAAARLDLRNDTSGNPVVSGTFVLDRRPRPDERLGPLVRHGTLALDVEVTGLEPDLPVASMTVELRDGTSVLATAQQSGPFLHAAMQATLDGPAARSALEAVLGVPTSLSVAAEIRLRAQSATPTRVRVHLGRVWATLDAAADGTRRFLPVDVDNYLAGWLADGTVVVTQGSGDPDHVRPAFLRAAGPVLDADLVLSARPPGDLTVTGHGGLPESVAAAPVILSVPLADLVAPRVAPTPSRYLHVVSAQGGELVDVPPVRTTARPRGAARGGALQVLAAGRVVGLGTVLHPEAPRRPLPIRPEALALVHADRPQVLEAMTIALPDLTDRRPGPLVSRVDAPLWMDRWDSTTAWYLPVLTPVRPEPTVGIDESPFRFEVRPDVGHTADGTQALTATVTVRLRPEQSAATTAALEATEYATVRPVPLTGITVQLGVPFRDQGGTAKVEMVTAEEVVADGVLGEPGSSVTVTFRLLDSWARLAYGALSTPGFQASPPVVSVSASFEGWSEQGRRPTVLGLDKRWALSGFATRDAAPAVRPTAALLATPLVSASIRPAWQFRPELLDRLDTTTYAWRQFDSTSRAELVMPCAELGSLYREWRDDAWHDVGCRPALQLGEVEHRTYAPLDVDAAGAHAKVYRSLRSPGRFLVVPAVYAVGRYGADAGDRAYRPRMLLHSSVDDEDPTEIRCVLAASLEPVLPPFLRSALLAELREEHHPDAVLEYLPDAGEPVDVRWAVPGATSLESVTTDTGFDVVCTTDLAGFLALRSMIERDGLSGVAEVDLPGGVRVSTRLKIGLSDVTGPFQGGPVELVAEGDRVRVTNRCGQRTAVLALASRGAEVVEVGQVLEPAASVTCDAGGTAVAELDVVYEHDRGRESLDEVRAYIEDLQVGVLFVSVADPASDGLAGLEIRTRFLGRDDPEPLVLTSDRRDGERSYVLPLTAFAADPVLEFVVVAVAPDGTRQESPTVSWPVRTRGALVPVGPPV